jgi:hypothetical protein
MTAVKKHFGKTDGVVAYHGYQSFAPTDRVTPETAHEIGVKLAERLWGERFQVLVCTHLDKANHLHNHFVVNNVSMVDGRKYYRSEKDYYDMQRESDTLCREYGLSVIAEPERGKYAHYAEWNAEREGKQTWRGLVKSDVDVAIKKSMTERQFFENLRKMGYEIKIGKDISFRPPGKERFVRLQRNFGDDYTIERIRKRILTQSNPERIIIAPEPKKVRLTGTFHRAPKLKGLRAKYYYYLYRMGVLPRKRTPNPKRVYFRFREDIRYMQNIARETQLLAKCGINTLEQLTAHKNGVTAKIIVLSSTRKKLRYKSRSIHDDEKLTAAKSEIAELSTKITELRREVKLCEDIETRSGVMSEKLRKSAELEKSKRKETVKNEPFR